MTDICGFGLCKNVSTVVRTYHYFPLIADFNLIGSVQSDKLHRQRDTFSIRVVMSCFFHIFNDIHCTTSLSTLPELVYIRRTLVQRCRNLHNNLSVEWVGFCCMERRKSLLSQKLSITCTSRHYGGTILISFFLMLLFIPLFIIEKSHYYNTVWA